MGCGCCGGGGCAFVEEVAGYGEGAWREGGRWFVLWLACIYVTLDTYLCCNL